MKNEWRRFELQYDENSPECQELYRLLDALHLSPYQLALIVEGLRLRHGVTLADFHDD